MINQSVFVSFSCSAPSSVTADGGDLDHCKAAVLLIVMELMVLSVFNMQCTFSVGAVFCNKYAIY